MGREKAESACIGYSGHELGSRYMAHAPLDKRVLDAEKVCDSGLEHGVSAAVGVSIYEYMNHVQAITYHREDQARRAEGGVSRKGSLI